MGTRRKRGGAYAPEDRTVSAPVCPLEEIDGMIQSIECEWPGPATREREAVDKLRFLLMQVRVAIDNPTYFNLACVRESLDKFEGRTP